MMNYNRMREYARDLLTLHLICSHALKIFKIYQKEFPNEFPQKVYLISENRVRYKKARTYIAPHPAASVLQFCHQTIYFHGTDIASHGYKKKKSRVLLKNEPKISHKKVEP